MEHRHWQEPESLAVITERGLAVFDQTPRPINFFHLPVPKSAMHNLDAYYEPLAKLLPKMKEQGTELYLGVVIEHDLEGTKKRIDAAKKALGDIEFGVATECGWGRTVCYSISAITRKLGGDYADVLIASRRHRLDYENFHRGVRAGALIVMVEQAFPFPFGGFLVPFVP